MNPIISIALIIVGVILLSYGLISADSLASRFSNFFSGHPTDKTVWLCLSGGIALLIGVTSVIRASRA
jgi:hypothetical protein